MGEFVWTPSPEQVESANVTRLARRLGVERYRDLHRISIEEPERFWPAVVEDLGLEFSEPWTDVVDVSRGPEWATWFVGGKLNLAWNCVHRWAAGELAEEEAAVWLAEDGGRVTLTWRELSEQVYRLAEGLASIGIGPGDAVGIYLPMSPQVAIASHACAHLGAVQVPIFSGFAAPAIAARLADAKAKALITADGSLRRGNVVPMKEIADEAVQGAATVTHTVVWRRLGLDDVPMTIGRDRWWDELVADASGGLSPKQVDSEHPYLLAYTSGTTGKPKGALHVQAGFLASIAREVAYQTNVKPGDRIHFATDMGWIMGPWTVVGGGACGATVVYAEGAPDFPPDRLWRIVESERVTMLGVSPTLVRALIPNGEPTSDMSSLKAICTTGEPWNRDPYLWLFEHVGGGRVPIVNESGGTEVGACFLATCVSEPVKPVALGFPALGQDMDVFGADGNPVRGEVGELVCKRPSATSMRTGGASPVCGRTATGRPSTTTGTGSCTVVPTTRSTSRASASGRRSSSRLRSHTTQSRKPRRSACRTTSRAKSRGSSACCVPIPRERRSVRSRSRARSRTSSARRSSRTESCSCRRCRRRAARRSCAAPCARVCSAKIPATFRRWRIPAGTRRICLERASVPRTRYGNCPVPHRDRPRLCRAGSERVTTQLRCLRIASRGFDVRRRNRREW